MVSIRPDYIAYPPERGWGNDFVPLEKLQRLGFNDVMIDLVRRLPNIIICRPVFPSTQTIDYFQNAFPGSNEKYQLEDSNSAGLWPLSEGRIPPIILPLSKPLGGDTLATSWLLDTYTGNS